MSGNHKPKQKFTRTQIKSLGWDQCTEELRSLNQESGGNLTHKRERIREALYPNQVPQSSQSQPALTLPSQPSISANNEDVQWLLIKKTSGPVYTRIPKGSREKSCRVFTNLVNKVVSQNDKEAWELLLNFARCGLGSSTRGGKKHTSQATLINKRLQSFSSDSISIESPKERKEKKQKNKKTFNEDSDLSDQVSKQLAMGDVRGAVNLVTSRESVLGWPRS